jgi:hypothetical protein
MSKKFILFAAMGILTVGGVGCGGADGQDGSSCTVSDEGDGTKTIVCEDGTSVSVSDGQDSHNSLVKIVEEPAGGNCAGGGRAIQTGLDANDDGELGEDEIAQTSYVCDGADGTDGENGEDAIQTLIEVADEPLGENCATGGSRIQTGLDADGDGVLGEEEIAKVTYICEESCPEGMVLAEAAGACIVPQFTMHGHVVMTINDAGLFPAVISEGTPCTVHFAYDSAQPASSTAAGTAEYLFSNAPTGLYVSVGDWTFQTAPAPDALKITVEDGEEIGFNDVITIESTSNRMPVATDDTLIEMHMSSAGSDLLSSTSLQGTESLLSQFNDMGAIVGGCNSPSGDCMASDNPEPGSEFWVIFCMGDPATMPSPQ